MDYSKTVNLPQTDFPMKADLPKREPALLALWDKEKVYEQALKRRHGKPKFILHDGPPYANGHLHLGHALNKILKDMIVRYKTMAGFYAPYVPGWDCHGLPIELQLMKELKVTDKHKVGRARFREQAKAFAKKFVDVQREEFKRMGILGNWEHPYLTMDEAYSRVIVDCFERLKKDGYVYRGKKPVYWCSTDETALAEAEVEYENDDGVAIYVTFPGRIGNEKVNFIVWTTTPWTLPANVAIAVNPDEVYPMFKEDSGENYIVAAKLADDIRGKTSLKLHQTGIGFHGGDLVARGQAKHPWIDRQSRILPAGFVAMDAGTGIVHIAPGHGMEDYQLGSVHDLEIVSPVDDKGRFTDEVPAWEGLHVFKANPFIIEHLRAIGALIQEEKITHSYPHCWRCHRPVIFRATEQWFLNIDHKNLRKRLLAEIEKIDQNKGWIPAYGKSRISGMVESRPDWCLSRQRLWGVEIPEKFGGKDPDILDVWFDSGVSWAAVLKQPSSWPDLSYPADLYLEGSDQHRGWFQTSLIPSVALENQAPYKAVLTHGFVMDGEGRPMSKSLGNVISPEEIIKQYGADVLRFWVAASDYGGDVRLSQEILKGASDNYRKVRNTLRYLLNNLTDFDPAKTVAYKDLPDIDRWALHRLQDEITQALKAYETYQFYRVTSRLGAFCGTDLSSFYLDIAKDRLYCDAADSSSRRAAQTVLYHTADALIRLLAPILSFTADESWRFLRHPESVALTDLPEANPKWMDAGFKRWDNLFSVREKILSALEDARKNGVIKRSFEARVILNAPDEATFRRLKEQEALWASIALVAQVEIAQRAIPGQEGLGVLVGRTEWSKCARCWIHKKDVGVEKRWPDVCGRCAQVLEELDKTGKPVSA